MTDTEALPRPRLLPTRVVIVGAGITGLSAAQELVERGFEVAIVERQIDPFDANCPEIGGLARSQWAAVPLPFERQVPPPPREEEQNRSTKRKRSRADRPRLKQARTTSHTPNQPAVGIELALELTCNKDGEIDFASKPQPSHTAADNEKTFKEYIEEFKSKEKTRPIPVQVAVAFYEIDTPPPLPGESDERKRAKAVRQYVWGLLGLGPDMDTASKQGLFFGDLVPISRRDKIWRDTPFPADRPILEPGPFTVHLHVSLAEDVLPGEHGFRFFPSCYRHLFDTMKRARLQFPSARRRGFSEDSRRTLFDNLVPTRRLRYGTQDGKAWVFERTPPRSFKQMRDTIKGFLGTLGCTADEALRVSLHLLRYATSCAQRRQEYERMTWAEFIQADELEPETRRILLDTSQILVSVRGDETDARTVGNIAMQLLLDQLRDSGYSDGTLNGPTSTALFKPWREYLMSQEVEFFIGEFVGFDIQNATSTDGPAAVLPRIVHCDENGKQRQISGLRPGDYTIIALPCDAFAMALIGERDRKCWPRSRSDYLDKPVAADQQKTLSYADRVTAKIVELQKAGESWKDPNGDAVRQLQFYDSMMRGARKRNALRAMIGLQFYLPFELELVQGHTLYPNSPWGISAIAQSQFWTQRRRSHDGHRGIISAIVTILDEPGRLDKTVTECTANEIAEEVWLEIMASLPEEERERLDSHLADVDVYFHIDDAIEFEEREQGQYGPYMRNDEPYLVNMVEQWSARPGRTDKPGYKIEFGNIVLAGITMKTFTRVNSMEAANESARRAVNAILRRVGHGGIPMCELWNPEELELDDLVAFKQLDEKLYARALPHVLDQPGLSWALDASALGVADLLLGRK